MRRERLSYSHFFTFIRYSQLCVGEPSQDVVREHQEAFEVFIKACSITPVDSQTIDESVASDFRDFEDAMQYYSALREGADVIITRNKNDYQAAQIPVYEPQEYLDLLTKR